MLPSSINATAIASTTTVRERFSVAFAVLFMGILLLFQRQARRLHFQNQPPEQM